MKIFLIDTANGDVINEIGSDTVLSLASLENVAIRAVPSSDTNAQSVDLVIGDQTFTLNDAPYDVFVGGSVSPTVTLSEGEFSFSAQAYS